MSIVSASMTMTSAQIHRRNQCFEGDVEIREDRSRSSRKLRWTLNLGDAILHTVKRDVGTNFLPPSFLDLSKLAAKTAVKNSTKADMMMRKRIEINELAENDFQVKEDLLKREHVKRKRR